MYVISFVRVRRRFGPWLRTFLIALVVLGSLFVIYRLFMAPVPAVQSLPADRPSIDLKRPSPAGEPAADAERRVAVTEGYFTSWQ